MARLLGELQRPCGRDYYDLVHAGREGVYWQAGDGLIVRLAAAEAKHEHRIGQVLLDLAVRYASGK